MFRGSAKSKPWKKYKVSEKKIIIWKNIIQYGINIFIKNCVKLKLFFSSSFIKINPIRKKKGIIDLIGGNKSSIEL